MERERGTVKWFNEAKGFGFIERGEGQPDVFVHHTAIMAGGYRSLVEGDHVEFDVGTDHQGRPKATNVRRVA